jgi:hypothetical protein
MNVSNTPILKSIMSAMDKGPSVMMAWVLLMSKSLKPTELEAKGKNLE